MGRCARCLGLGFVYGAEAGYDGDTKYPCYICGGSGIREESVETIQENWTNKLECKNTLDENGNPTGGWVRGVGLSIDWQDGPLGRGTEKKEPTGAFVEDVILAAIQRLQFYNDGKFRCRENSLAITHLEEALHWCQARHEDRERRGVQGLHEA